MDKYAILKQYFGFDSFRPIQEKAIEQILQKKDILTVLPTGSGKSLIFQLPTLMMDGLTVVISPLIALMQDQVANLNLNGISAKMLSSQNTQEQNAQTSQELLNGELKFLYIAPERFSNQEFRNMLKNLKINFFVIDEAHCVSEWGHEFRDDYRKLSSLKGEFPNTAIAAFTATATNSVQSDILNTLKIDPNNMLKGKIQRKNLLIRASKRLGNGKEQIIDFLNTHKDECGIVYCFTRSETQKLSSFLNEKGFDTLAYHAGLPSGQRDRIFQEFKNENVKIIVATIAFGMGIDKGNIRFVLHTSMPKTLENYSQEIGRAGRDGLKSEVLLLYSKSDEIAKRRFIDDMPQGNYKTTSYEKLQTMYRFASSSNCRHQYIAKYFDDEIKECKTICDNCTAKDKQFEDISTQAQKFLSAVYRCEQKFGQNHIIDILKGSKSKKVLQFGHDNLSVYGIGDEFSKQQWGAVADKLLDMEALYIQGEFRTLGLSPLGMQILKGQQKVQIDKSNLENEKNIHSYKTDIVKDETFEKFKALRTKLAHTQNVAPYMIFSDKVLDEISKKLPLNEEEFLKINGIGRLKFEKYGSDFIELSKTLKDQGVKSKKTLSKTYLESLSLIEQNKTIEQIVKIRELQDTTILSHVKELFENQYISMQTKEKLIKPLKDQFPHELKVWIESKLDKFDTKTLRKYLSIYDLLNQNSTQEKK